MASAAVQAAPVRIGPQPGPQEAFLRCSADIAFYGGEAGGGKTYALLLNPLYYVSNPKFGCVTFRRTTKMVREEGALWDEAMDLYPALGATPNQTDLHFTWPSGSRCRFAHMEYEKNRHDWQGAQIPLIQYDQLEHFTYQQFNYLLSRNRSVSGVPGMVRATLNPDPDHWVRRWIDWWIGSDGLAIDDRSGVIRWFVMDGDSMVWDDSPARLRKRYPGSIPKSFTFFHARLEDNPVLMEKDPGYLANLMALTRVDRMRLRGGNWNVRPTAGMFFARSDFEILDACPPLVREARAWDQAGTKPATAAGRERVATDPDWTAGVRMGVTREGQYVIRHVERFREDPPKVTARIKNTAEQDGKGVVVRLAQDPGQAGKSQVRAQTTLLAGWSVSSKPVTGDKQTRAKPLSSQAEAGNVALVRGSWNDAFLDELQSFPDGAHDDQVDAAADALDELAGSPYTLAGVA